jgi:NADPH:quinone reductase-like Zn-dependent oxidoreductase
MRAIKLTDRGIDNLKAVECEEPVPGPGEVLVELRAASLNSRDLAVITGSYPARLPLVPLSDGAGVVVGTGPGVRRVRAGERVCPIFAPAWVCGPPTREALGCALGGGSDGVLRDRMLVHESALVRVPDHLTDEEAACLPVAAVTAWSALRVAGLTAGQTVLIEGTGGVSLFALQFAKVSGARVIVVASGPEKARRAGELGADATVDRSAATDWPKEVLAATDGHGVDIVVEVGGADSLPKAVQTLRMEGRISAVGLASGALASLPLQMFVPKAASLRGVVVGSRDTFEEMNRIIALHRLRPVIDRTFGRDQLVDALKYFKDGRQFGKVVLKY